MLDEADPDYDYGTPVTGSPVRIYAKAVPGDRLIDPYEFGIEGLFALSHLTDDQREAWVDYHMLGRTYRDIAEDMGFSHPTVMLLERTASRRLAQIMDLQAA